MAMTLANADLLSAPWYVRGIIETIIEESGGILERLPFESVEGELFHYNRESTLSTVDFYDVNEVIAESSPTHTEHTVTLRRIIGDSDLDKFEARTKGNGVVDLQAEYIRAATKSMTRKFLDKFFYGDATANTKEFDGLVNLCDTAQATANITSATVGKALSLATLDTAIDKIKPGKPDLILMTKDIRRRLSQALRSTSVSGYINWDRDEFGKRVLFYDGIPIIPCDFLVQTEDIAASVFSAKTGGLTSTLWMVKFGSVPEGGLCGLQASMMAELEIIDPVPNKDAMRHRVKWYVNMALGSIYSLSNVFGVTDAAVTA